VSPAGTTSSLLDEIIQRSPVGMAVIGADGNFQVVNPAYCEILGYTAGELLGNSITSALAAQHHADVLALHRQLVAAGTDWQAEWDLRRRDGAQLNVLSLSLPVPGEQGGGRRLVYIVDITQRKQAELALQASQQFLHSVLDGVTVVKPNPGSQQVGALRPDAPSWLPARRAAPAAKAGDFSAKRASTWAGTPARSSPRRLKPRLACTAGLAAPAAAGQSPGFRRCRKRRGEDPCAKPRTRWRASCQRLPCSTMRWTLANGVLMGAPFRRGGCGPRRCEGRR
jgi:PAS domain S-box-containing protein